MKQDLIEEWKPIEGYEGLYEVSNLGNVKTLGRTIIRNNGMKQVFKEKILKKGRAKNGYYTVSLTKLDGSRRSYTVHSLVANAFLSPKNACVNHKDCNKSNNHVDNLEWCTYSENELHAYNHGLIPRRHLFGKDNATSKRVIQSKDGVDIKTWDSMIDADRAGFSMKCISNCCAHRSNSHKGYQWRYAE